MTSESTNNMPLQQDQQGDAAVTVATATGTSSSAATRISTRRSTAVSRSQQENGGDGGPDPKRRKSTDDGGSKNGGSEGEEGQGPSKRDEVVSLHVEMEPLPGRCPALPALTRAELRELERVLELGAVGGDGWRDDWMGNLGYADKEVRNPQVKSGIKPFRQTLLEWAKSTPANTRLVWNLVRHVCQLKGTPEAAKRLLLSCDPESVTSLEKAIRRTTYDPTILRQDGWTTAKSAEKEGATGGPFLIGDIIQWENAEAVVIAYVHDHDIGDLWKAIWTGDDHDDHLVTFDLEAEELFEAKRKQERRQQRLSAAASDSASGRASSRQTVVKAEFRVAGIETGIVLATSYSKGARPGVYWPARIMNASEVAGTLGKRASSRQKLDVVFLAPYWNSQEQSFRSGRRVESLSESGASVFSAGPLFQIETVEATGEMIIEYPYEGKEGLDVPTLQTTFRFTGLPRAAFPRFLNSHRLAHAFRKFAKDQLDCAVSPDMGMATAGLFETHPMAVQAPVFPPVVLHLPFEFILSQLPHPDNHQALASRHGDDRKEPVLQLGQIIDNMKPPHCWGLNSPTNQGSNPPSPELSRLQTNASSPGIGLLHQGEQSGGNLEATELDRMITDFSLLKKLFASSASQVSVLLKSMSQFVSSISQLKGGEVSSSVSYVESWVLLKRLGEDTIYAVLKDKQYSTMKEWRHCSEGLYGYMTSSIPSPVFQNGHSVILTDYQCNGHLTSSGCFERSVRIPAALKAVRLAGGTTDSNSPIQLITEIPQKYVNIAEKQILVKAHGYAYLKRIKSRCASLTNDADVAKLTDDSSGEGGHDTFGSRGTWTASVRAVAAAIWGAEKIVLGGCVNAFCATRPPGHHAGRSLHPMKAVSNGFCVLNAAACAAIYATTPLHEGGLGLSRVCVIDFDAHHGNGTQDILCSTYDPRYLYISLHAGGAEVNGIEHSDDPSHELHDLANNPKSGGIFPGRCGDTSPHKGVLNIPLGSQIKAHDVGTALVKLVSPAVEAFSPDLIILSAGFDAHKNDPMGLGRLSAEDFGHITEVACQLAFKTCSGRVLSVLEGGYGVPCCRYQKETESEAPGTTNNVTETSAESNKNGAPESGPVAMNGGAPKTTNSYQPPSAPSATTNPDAQQNLDSTEEIAPAGSGTGDNVVITQAVTQAPVQRPQPSKLCELGGDLPETMDDQVPYALQRRLEKCHSEGFIECVKEHVQSLARCNKREGI